MKRFAPGFQGGSRIWAFLLCALVTCIAAAAQPTRLAILTGDGDRAVDDATLAQVEVALTDVKEVTLLERAQIRTILAEQKLSAAGLTDPATAVKLGKLLSVEMFLFLDRVPKTQPPICRVQVIETRTGIALDGALMEESSLGQAEGGLGPSVRRALAKRQAPLADRRYAAILGLRNEEPGQALDGLARTLWMLLSTDLQECPSLVLLDREHLQRLREEKQLTDAEQALKLSTVLLEGGIRHSAERGKVELTLLIQPLAGGEPERLALRFDPAKLEPFRRELVAAITERLKLKPPSLTAGDPEKEGRRFLAQSQMLTVCGEKDAALRAIEAAYALWPDRTTRLELIASYDDRILGHLHHTSTTSGVQDWGEFDKATEQEQVRSMRLEMQMLSLLCEQYQLDFGLDGDSALPKITYQQEYGLRTLPTLGLLTRSAKGEAAALQPEVAALQRKLLDVAAAAAKKDPKNYGIAYWEALESALHDLCFGGFEHAAAKAAGWREIFILWRDAPTGRGDANGGAFRSFGMSLRVAITNALQSLPKASAETRRPFVEAFSAFRGDPDPAVRFVANIALFIIDPASQEAAEAILKYMRDEINWAEHPPGRDPDLSIIIWRAVDLLRRTKPALAAAYCEEVIGAWLKEGGESWRLAEADTLQGEWVKVVEETKGKVEADAVCQRLIAGLQDSLKRWPNLYPETMRGMIRSWETYREKLGVAPPAAPGPDSPWNLYDVQRVPLGLKKYANSVIVRKDRLYCILLTNDHKGRHSVTVTVHAFPAGGPALWTQTLTLPAENTLYVAEGMAAMMADRLYIGTTVGVVTLTETDPPRLLTEADGLPGTLITAVATYGGKLYLGIGPRSQPKHAFAVYDPASRQGRTIVSNTTLEADRRRDIVVQALLADPGRNCLWIGSDSLYRYTPETDKLDRVIEWVYMLDAGHTMIFAAQGLLYAMGSSATWLDLKNVKQTCLLGSDGLVEDKPLFGYPGTSYWPAYYDGQVLITGGKDLLLHRVGQEPVRCRLAQDIAFFEPTDEGLLAMGRKGDGYLIRKKPSASGEMGAKP